MCLGIPMQVVHINGIAAECVGDDGPALIDVTLIPDTVPGEWVLTFLGTAQEKIDPDQAHKIKMALRGLSSLMQGGELGDAFADLESRPPSLPPHLQAALDAGQSQG